MMKHALIPLEGDSSVDAVLPWVPQLQALGVSELTLLRTELPVAADEYAVVREALLEQARARLASARRRFAEVHANVRTLARIGPAVTTVLEVAREKEVSLIVAPIARPSRLSRFLFGNTTERLAERSPIPVLAVPPRGMDERDPVFPAEERPLRTVLVLLDGLRASAAILRPAIEISRASGARLLLASVIPESHPDCGDFEETEDLLYAAGADCAAAGVEFSVIVESGNPLERIVALCKDRPIDWIAISSPRRTAWTRWLHSSPTLQVLRRSWLPTLTIRPEAATPVRLEALHALERH